MLKPNDWYYVPLTGEKEVIGTLLKVLSVNDNPLYVTVESWDILKNRKFKHTGINGGNDVVYIQKHGKKISAPPKMFEVLYSDTVNGIVDRCQETDDQNEYDED
jgi:hypothetical protein